MMGPADPALCQGPDAHWEPTEHFELAAPLGHPPAGCTARLGSRAMRAWSRPPRVIFLSRPTTGLGQASEAMWG